MRKFAFQELAYAIVVATSYGLLMGILFNQSSDFIIFLIWALLICAHLAGILLIVRLEEGREKSKEIDKTT
ncbi:MAG: hypothetical protein ACFFAJ_12065 [Candidatus Hodarchaeota archaeon]